MAEVGEEQLRKTDVDLPAVDHSVYRQVSQNDQGSFSG